jgi:hypothetical protein
VISGSTQLSALSTQKKQPKGFLPQMDADQRGFEQWRNGFHSLQKNSRPSRADDLISVFSDFS